MTVTTRFAPSPTGRLHVGNVRMALHNWLLARKSGGRFLLRLDDTDAERSREEHAESIRADLAWLGLNPDGEERQSARFALYEAEFAKLAAAGRVYRCYETAQELDLKRKVLLGRGLPPIYDRAALALSDADHAARAEAGDKPHWRFLLDRGEPIEWLDGIRGPQRFDPAQMSDPVIRRADGSWLYMLPSAIDDVAMGITDVLRGEDHVSNTATQMQMFTALGAEPPRFAHEALLVGTEGKLSKRLGSLGVAELREAGVEPEAPSASPCSPGSALRTRSIRRSPPRTSPPASTSPTSAAPRRASTRPSCTGSTRGSSTACPSRAPAACSRRAWARPPGRRSAPTSPTSARRPSGGR